MVEVPDASIELRNGRDTKAMRGSLSATSRQIPRATFARINVSPQCIHFKSAIQRPLSAIRHLFGRRRRRRRLLLVTVVAETSHHNLHDRRVPDLAVIRHLKPNPSHSVQTLDAASVHIAATGGSPAGLSLTLRPDHLSPRLKRYASYMACTTRRRPSLSCSARFANIVLNLEPMMTCRLNVGPVGFVP